MFKVIITHIHWLVQKLARCQEIGLSLNLAKCAFDISNGMFLGHIVNKDGSAIDPTKVAAIMEANNAKELGRFLGMVRWHR